MQLSHLLFQPVKNPPKDADTINHRLLVQAGYVRQLMAGVYSYTTLGLQVLRNIEKIVREEMNAVGGQEILMPALHPKLNWTTTGGWENIDVLFKLQSRTGKEYALGQSHEEIVTPLAKEFIHSYKDLPLALYQIQWKYRDELRAKSGILRGREFYMKDMYSFHSSQESFEEFYQVVKQAYLRVYKRLGLTAKVTEASGGNFTDKISYEFMVLTDAGEDDIYYCDACDYCINQEIATVKEGDPCPKCGQPLKKARAAEVGNVFDLGQKFTKAFDLQFTDQNGEKHFPIMGCYGIGISRCMGVIVEKYNDEKGILWPESVAPVSVELLSLAGAEEFASQIYDKLQSAGIKVLWDDRNLSAGNKFADADLLGIPERLIVSPRNGEKIEWQTRDKKESALLDLETLLEKYASLTHATAL
jgi:prolyl-tRNA synthetase